MEILKLISENPNISSSPLWSIAPLVAAGLISAGIKGVTGILGGVIGGRKRRQEQRAANAEMKQRTAAYEGFDFQNAYANMENPYEDLRVATQGAEFQAQQQQQGLANTLDALRQSGGGLGAAAVAQSLAMQQSANQQQISASIAEQEVNNERMAAQGQMQMQMQEAQGAMQVQGMEFGRTETLLGMSQQRSAAADQARQQATQSLVGGIGSLAGAAASFGLAGGFKSNAPTMSSQDMIDSNVALARIKPVGGTYGINAPLLTKIPG